jgi:hypothetical protein
VTLRRPRAAAAPDLYFSSKSASSDVEEANGEKGDMITQPGSYQSTWARTASATIPRVRCHVCKGQTSAVISLAARRMQNRCTTCLEPVRIPSPKLLSGPAVAQPQAPNSLASPQKQRQLQQTSQVAGCLRESRVPRHDCAPARRPPHVARLTQNRETRTITQPSPITSKKSSPCHGTAPHSPPTPAFGHVIPPPILEQRVAKT